MVWQGDIGLSCRKLYFDLSMMSHDATWAIITIAQVYTSHLQQSIVPIDDDSVLEGEQGTL